jgi:thiopurine S-methyltransferase
MQKQNSYWLELWQLNNIHFHEKEGTPFVINHFKPLNLKPDATVFVPLCGKSKDLLWLMKQGHQVIGIELSQIACNDFFEELNIKPTIHQNESFTIYQYNNLTIFCGDLFNLKKSYLPKIDMVYDCKALIALPPATRKQYVDHLIKCLGHDITILLLSLESHDAISGPPFVVTREEINQLYSPYFNIQELERKVDINIKNHLVQKGFTEKTDVVYLLTSKL